MLLLTPCDDLDELSEQRLRQLLLLQQIPKRRGQMALADFILASAIVVTVKVEQRLILLLTLSRLPRQS